MSHQIIARCPSCERTQWVGICRCSGTQETGCAREEWPVYQVCEDCAIKAETHCQWCGEREHVTTRDGDKVCAVCAAEVAP